MRFAIMRAPLLPRRRGEVNFLFVQRFSENGAVQPKLRERAHIRKGGNPTGGDERKLRETGGKAVIKRKVCAGKQTVLGNIRADDALHAEAGKPGEKFFTADGGGFKPAVRGDKTIPYVYAHGHARAEAPHRAFKESRSHSAAVPRITRQTPTSR